MPVRLKLLALLFAVPLLAIVVASGGRAYADSPAAFDWLGGFGALAAFIAVLMLGAIRWAGRACQRDRLLLLKVFRPGLHVVFIVLIVLIVMHAGLVIGGTALVGATGGGVGRLLIWVAIGAAVGVWRMIREASRAVGKASTSVVGKVLEPGKHAALLDTVADVARTIGSETPDRVVAGLDPSFFVTEA